MELNFILIFFSVYFLLGLVISYFRILRQKELFQRINRVYLLSIAVIPILIFILLFWRETTKPLIEILSPQQFVQIDPNENQQVFPVHGRIKLDTKLADSKIYIFLKPIVPPGGGYFKMDVSATISADGTWTGAAYWGSNGAPVKVNHECIIVAAVDTQGMLATIKQLDSISEIAPEFRTKELRIKATVDQIEKKYDQKQRDDNIEYLQLLLSMFTSIIAAIISKYIIIFIDSKRRGGINMSSVTASPQQGRNKRIPTNKLHMKKRGGNNASSVTKSSQQRSNKRMPKNKLHLKGKKTSK